MNDGGKSTNLCEQDLSFLPANLISVGYQSVEWSSSLLFTPFCCSVFPCTKATPLTPPSQRVFFWPRSGQLNPPDPGSPPLSVVKINNVFSQRLQKTNKQTNKQTNKRWKYIKQWNYQLSSSRALEKAQPSWPLLFRAEGAPLCSTSDYHSPVTYY